MKKCLLVFPFIIFLNNIILCQVRHVKGHDFFGLYVGYGKEMYAAGGTYQRYFSNKISGKVMGIYDKLLLSKTDYNSVSIYPQFEYCLLTNNVNLYFNIRPGIFSGVEFLSDEFKNTNRLFFGESIGLGFEFFISSRFKIDLSVDERIYQRSRVVRNYGTLFLGFSKLL